MVLAGNIGDNTAFQVSLTALVANRCGSIAVYATDGTPLAPWNVCQWLLQCKMRNTNLEGRLHL